MQPDWQGSAVGYIIGMTDVDTAGPHLRSDASGQQ